MCDSVTVCHLTVNNCSGCHCVILCVSCHPSESDAWSAVTESSEDVSLSSASDVSMIVYEFKDGMGMPK